MLDPRWSQLAGILVNYSTRVQPGERVLIALTEPDAFPAAQAVYEQVVIAGGLPHVQLTSVLLERALLVHASDQQVDWVPEPELDGMAWADVSIGLRGASNPYELADIDLGRLARRKRSQGVVSTARTERTRWVLARIPNAAFAQQAGMPLEVMLDFFFAATLRDWADEARGYEALRARFQRAETVRITGAGTDLTFSTRGRVYLSGDGRINMPDGEIYTAPVEDSAHGVIAFEQPAFYAGQRLDRIRLAFTDGEVTAATADSRQDLLDRVLATDPGARRLGEFGVGVNWGIDRFTGDILFDEKIGGTIHLALGRSYTDCGGLNASAIHWDLVKDLRAEGTIELDGEVVFAHGQFTI